MSKSCDNPISQPVNPTCDPINRDYCLSSLPNTNTGTGSVCAML